MSALATTCDCSPDQVLRSSAPTQTKISCWLDFSSHGFIFYYWRIASQTFYCSFPLCWPLATTSILSPTSRFCSLLVDQNYGGKSGTLVYFLFCSLCSAGPTYSPSRRELGQEDRSSNRHHLHQLSAIASTNPAVTGPDSFSWLSPLFRCVFGVRLLNFIGSPV